MRISDGRCALKKMMSTLLAINVGDGIILVCDLSVTCNRMSLILVARGVSGDYMRSILH